jgi:integrase
MSWDCIDFSSGVIKIYRQLQLLKSKGMKKGEYHFAPRKNNKPLIINPAPYVLRLLDMQKKRQAAMQLKAGAAWSNPDDLIFTTPLGNHLDISALYRAFKKVAKCIGVPETRFHDLRHTFAALSLLSGDDPKTLQGNLGHYSAAFTLDRYGHIMERMKKKSSEHIQGYIEGVLNKKP